MRPVVIASAIAAGLAAAAAAQTQDGSDFAGPVSIDGDRRVHLECAGHGAPTVILVSGYRNDAEVWTVDLGPRATAVFPAVAAFTKVCAYDRPGTILDAARRGRSDPVPMPRSASEIVAEFDALLTAARLEPPFVLAAHSLGGVFARLYASLHPENVAGLVLVDAWQESLQALLGPEQWAAYVALAAPPPAGLEGFADLELVDFAAASAAMAAAGPLGDLPLYVISRGKPVQLPPDPPAAFSPERFEAAWRDGQTRLAALRPDSRRMLAQASDHYVQLEQPELVVEAIAAVVAAVRDPPSWDR